MHKKFNTNNIFTTVIFLFAFPFVQIFDLKIIFDFEINI